jgi:hypothetical protein
MPICLLVNVTVSVLIYISEEDDHIQSLTFENAIPLEGILTGCLKTIYSRTYED